MEYFENTYIKTDSNWFEGFAEKTPSTNNCLEVFNRLLKDQQTMHLRKPLHQFLVQALDIVRERSKAYIQDKAAPSMCVTLNDKLKLSALNYSTSAKTMAHEMKDGLLLFYVFAGENMNKITLQDARKFEKMKYKTFDEFASSIFAIHKITFVATANWENGKCTCVSFAKNYICKQVLMIAYRLQTLEPADDLLMQVETPAPVKAPRGRPRKATKALIRD